MNATSQCLPIVLATHRSGLRRVLDRLREGVERLGAWRRARRAVVPAPLPDGLDEATLRDVGFAAWQTEQREVQRLREIGRWL